VNVAYQILSLEQEEQIRSMRKAGKTTPECQDFIKTTYNIDVPAWKISYIVGKAPGTKPAKGKRKYHKREAQPATSEIVPIEQATQDIIKGLDQIREGYTAIFMHLRLAVIKEKGKVFNMAKAAGIDVKEEDVKE
jgi:hypothetical protein